MKTRRFFFILLSIFLTLKPVVSQVDLNLFETPFSYYGSWMALSVFEENNNDNLYIRDICGRRMWQNNKVFKIESLSGEKVISTRYRADEALLIGENDKGKLEICYENDNTLRIRGKGEGMKLTMTAPEDRSSLYIPVEKGQWRIQMGGFPHYVYTTLKGESKIVKGSRLTVNMVNENYEKKKIELEIDIKPDKDGEFEISFEQYESGWINNPNPKDFDACVSYNKEIFSKWCSNNPVPPKGFEKASALANYINWSCVVNPRGNITVPVMLSSKNHMHSIWTWDNCIFSMSMAYKMPEQAWEQYFFVLNKQDEIGNFPNLLNDVSFMRGFAAPQLFGWALKRMIITNPSIGKKENIEKAYPLLAKSVDFWFTYQDDDKDGIPEYHHGNESGMDNSSAFDVGMSLESPDLCAYLIVTMDLLAEFSDVLGYIEESGEWKERADELLDKMIKNLWTGERFVAKRSFDNEINKNSQSIILYIPLILGERLPADVSKKMIKDLKNNGQFTEIGLASENPNSKLYADDSYWRGPVWSPPTLIISQGVRECGDEEFAREIAGRYCENCVKNGFGENYSAFSGVSLKDKSLPWTAAVYQILIEEFYNKP